jgi:cytochrome oxidase Cu insertion factor (SCO1/SenC/PrrC family)
MIRKRTSLCLVFLCLITSFYCENDNPSQPEQSGPYTIGQKVADFTLNDIDEASVSLSDYNNKIVLLYFFSCG